jgi:hypothetical protein
MDTNSSDRQPEARSYLGDLIAGVPYTLGFHPARSLIVLILDDGHEVTAGRLDLPELDHYPLVAAQLRGSLVWQDVTEVALLVVCEAATHPDGTLPYGHLINVCATHLAETGIKTCHQLWAAATTSGSPWASYRDADCHGVVPDSDSHARAVGGFIYARREDMATALLPDNDDVLARRANLLATISEIDPHEGLDLVDNAVELAVDGILPESDQHLVALAASLCDSSVRDSCLKQPDLAHRDAAERLWTKLVQATPAPERAESACLLAFSAFQRGNGALTTIALDCALEANPAHRLSELLRTAMTIASHRSGCATSPNAPPPARATSSAASQTVVSHERQRQLDAGRSPLPGADPTRPSRDHARHGRDRDTTHRRRSHRRPVGPAVGK